MSLRWGIVTAGLISHDFVNALATLPSDQHQVVAVAARDLHRAVDFAKLHNIPSAYGDYSDIGKDANVEVVYIGALNPQHYDIALMMLQMGKHVFCEKPLCMNARQTADLIRFAQSKNLFLMEAICSRFFPAYTYLKEQITSGHLGIVTEVKVGFGLDLKGLERLEKNDLGGGTILDLGVYTIQLSQWVFGEEQPIAIKAEGQLNGDGCDVAVKAEFTYSNGGVAKIETSALEQWPNVAIIKGTKGVIKLPNFACPTTLIDIDGREKSWPLPKTQHKSNFSEYTGLCYEAEEVRRCIRGRFCESQTLSHQNSLIIAKIQDKIRQLIGVKYLADE